MSSGKFLCIRVHPQDKTAGYRSLTVAALTRDAAKLTSPELDRLTLRTMKGSGAGRLEPGLRSGVFR
jgi:hypothetical protein